jgi:hypothetical protein
MPATFYAIEKFGHVDIRAFRLTLPEFSDKGFYRSVTSYQAYREREIHRAWPHLKKKKTASIICAPQDNVIWYSLKSQEDYDMLAESWLITCDICNFEKPVPNPDPNLCLLNNYFLPCQNIDGMFDFYKAIGYDYKNQKYLPESEVMQFATDETYRIETVNLARARMKRDKRRVLPSAPA